MIHVAGRLVDGVQHCLRCGAVLADYRNAMIPKGDPEPTGWAPGAHVELIGRNPAYFGLTAAPADCEALH